jgi:hypothetical protein
LIDPEKRRLQLRSLPEILFNSAAMVTAKICAISHNACESLTTFYAQQKFAQPMPRTQLSLLGGLAPPDPGTPPIWGPVSIPLPDLRIYGCAPDSRHPAEFFCPGRQL